MTCQQIPETVTVHVPFRLVRRGGRKEMLVPEGAQVPRKPQTALVKALARAFRWQRMLETGEFATLGDLAQSEGVSRSYMTKLLHLTLLAPGIVEAILAGDEPEGGVSALMKSFSIGWTEQEQDVR
jgi:hypothetical protein